MTVREFNGVSDELVTGIGAASGMVHGTVATLVKFNTISGYRDWAMLHTAGGSFVWTPVGLTDFAAFHMFSNGVSSYPALGPSLGVWYLIVARKATGSNAPRFSVYDLTAGTWTHASGASNLDDSLSPPGAGGQVRFTYQGSGDFFGGRIAARALWSNTLPWSADSAGDAAIEASGLKDSAVNWSKNGPSAFWLFNQESTTTPVDDLSVGGTADQMSISGTTAVAGDDPPGFDFSSDGMLLELGFDEASGNALDSSGHGRDLTITGNLIRTADGDGHTGKGLTQNVAAASVGPSIVGLQTTSRTWMAWIKFNASVTAWVMEYYATAEDTGAWGLLDLSGTIRFRAKNASNTVFESTAITRNAGVWQHIAATHDGANLKTYVNGTLLSTTPMAFAVKTADTFRVLDQTGSQVVIDDARLFGTALTQAEIATLMSTPVGGAPPINVGALDGSFSSPVASATARATAEVTVDGTFAAPVTAIDVRGATNAVLAGSFASPAFSSSGDSTSPNVGGLNGSFASPGATLSARSSVDVSMIGTFSIPAFTGTGGVPIPSRDILVTIGPGDRPATSIAAGPSRVSVAASTIQRTEIGA
jgi:hypothetical protein